MRLIGQLPQAAAETFARHLQRQSIECQLDAPSGTASNAGAAALDIWVFDEDRVDAARALFSRFLSMPDAPEFNLPPPPLPPQLAPQAPIPPASDSSDILFPHLSANTIPTTRHIPWLSLSVLLLLALAWFSPAVRDAFSFDSDAILSGAQLWRLFTPALLTDPHFGGLTFFAAIWILHFGRHLELHRGPMTCLLLLLLTAGTATLLTAYAIPALSELLQRINHPFPALDALAQLPPGPCVLAYALYAYWLIRLRPRSAALAPPLSDRRRILLPGTHLALIAILVILFLTSQTSAAPLLYLLSALPAALLAPL